MGGLSGVRLRILLLAISLQILLLLSVGWRLVLRIGRRRGRKLLHLLRLVQLAHGSRQAGLKTMVIL